VILLIDNYDSFTYNLLQYIGEVTEEKIPLKVIRNDQISVSGIQSLNPSHIILSPGPCTPNKAGICLELVSQLYKSFPILGVCLGHQSIAQALGGKVIRAEKVFHGKISEISHDNLGIFKGLEQNFTATRYHSLIVEEESLPNCLEVSAWTKTKDIMAIRHKAFPHLVGLQFHPESILTFTGKQLLSAFVSKKIGEF